MGISDLSRWLTNLVSSDLLETRLESMLLGLRANLKTRSAQLHEVSSAYANEKLVLVLGAGVSQDYLLPSWSSLLQQLLIRSLADGGGDAAHTAAVARCIPSSSTLIRSSLLATFDSICRRSSLLGRFERFSTRKLRRTSCRH